MNNLGPKKKKWLEDQGCYFVDETDSFDPAGENTNIYINTNNGKVYVGLADLGEKESTVNIIYKHRLTNLDTAFPGSGCQPVSIGFSEDEQAWYGWTNRGFGKFNVGYEIKEDSCMNNINPAYPRIKHPFKCETLEDCKDCALKFAQELD